MPKQGRRKAEMKPLVFKKTGKTIDKKRRSDHGGLAQEREETLSRTFRQTKKTNNLDDKVDRDRVFAGPSTEEPAAKQHHKSVAVPVLDREVAAHQDLAVNVEEIGSETSKLEPPNITPKSETSDPEHLAIIATDEDATAVREKPVPTSPVQVQQRWGADDGVGDELASTPHLMLKELDAADQCSKRAAVAYLRQFDLAGQFGPCANVLRSHRYRRAVDLGLRPPLSVDVVLGRFLPDDPSVDQCYLSPYSNVL